MDDARERRDAIIDERPRFSDNAVYWTLSGAAMLCVALGLLVWHMSAQPSQADIAAANACVPGSDPSRYPWCHVSSGPWPARHWVLASLIAAALILLVGRALLFMHRMERRSA